MNIYLLGLIIPCLSFILQVWPRIVKRYFGVDTWRWLFFADYIRRHKSLPKKSPSQFIATSNFGYPPVVMLLLSLFSKNFLEKYQFLISPFFDFINNYLIFIASLVLSLSLEVALVAQIISMLIPLIVIEASNLNSRILGYLIFTISFFSLFMYSISSSLLYLLIAGVGLYILFFTHRFSIQAYIVSIIGFALAERTFFYPLFFLAILGLVFLTNRKRYLSIFKEHVASIKYWSDKIENRFAHQFRGNLTVRGTSDFIQKVYTLSTKNPIIYIIGNNPWILVFFAIFINLHFNFIQLNSLISLEIISKLEIWAFSLIIWSLMVLFIRPLRNFGEGQRYLEYCVLPISIIISSFLSPLINIYSPNSYILSVLIVISMLILIIYLQYKAIILDRARSINKGVWEIIKYINNHNGNKIRLAMFPLQMGDAMVYFTRCSILTSDVYSGLAKLDDIFPVIKKPLTELIKKYKISHIFFDRDFVHLDELKLKKYKILVDVDNFVLLKV